MGIDLIVIVLGATFVLSAALKLRDRKNTHIFLRELTHSTRVADLIATILPLVETLVAFLLVVTPIIGLYASIGLSLCFVVVTTTSYAKGVDVGCRCFGALDRSTSHGLSMLRATALLLLSTAGTVMALHKGIDGVHLPSVTSVIQGSAVVLVLAGSRASYLYLDDIIFGSQSNSNAGHGSNTTQSRWRWNQ